MLRAAAELVLLLWLAVFVSRLLEARVQRAPSLTPSLRVLTSKLIRFSLIALALVVALTSTGIDLTAFALFTGALGVGIGFGLQKPISNLISGLILLFDRSIKPGDVVELTDPGDHPKQLFGWVTALNARCVSLTTRDGTEWLVPNEDLITRRVINWSYSHNRLRLLTPDRRLLRLRRAASRCSSPRRPRARRRASCATPPRSAGSWASATAR